VDQDCDGNSDEFRNACNNCGDQYETGTSCRACRTLRSSNERIPDDVLISGTIDIPGDSDFYCVYLWDDVNVLGQTASLSLSPATGFDFAYHADVYRDVAACERGDALVRVSANERQSGFLQVTEPTIDMRGAGDDSGTYIIRITAAGADCADEYRLFVGLFD
jgi:hypothetical protein